MLPVLALSQTPAPESKEGASLEGVVISSATGEPVRKAILTLYRAGRGGLSITADSDSRGTFRLDDIEPGTYALSVARAGYVPQAEYRVSKSSPWLQLGPGQLLQDLVVKITPGATIAGRVLDQDGDARTGSAFVRLQRQVRTSTGKKFSDADSAEADSEGGFVFAGLTAGRYYLLAAPQPHVVRRSSGDADMMTYYPDAVAAEEAVPIDVTAGAEFRGADVRIRRGRTVHVRGHVIGATSINISLSAALGENANIPNVYTRNGAFDIPNVSPGTYRLTATSYVPFRNQEAYFYGQTTITVDQIDLDDVTVEVRRPLMVTGTIQVEGNSGAPPPLTLVRLMSDAVLPIELSTVGSFSTSNVPPTPVRVEASPPAGMYVKSINIGGQDYTRTPIEPSALEAGPLEILLSPNAAEITGTVRDENGEPAPGLSIALWTKGDVRPQLARAEEAGVFRFSNLAPGDYFVVAYPSGHDLSSADIPTLFETRAAKVTVQEGGHAAGDITLVTAEDIDELIAKFP